MSCNAPERVSGKIEACYCGESIDAVEVEDESQIIICKQKGCETLWMSCLFVSFHSA